MAVFIVLLFITNLTILFPIIIVVILSPIPVIIFGIIALIYQPLYKKIPAWLYLLTLITVLIVSLLALGAGITNYGDYEGYGRAFAMILSIILFFTDVPILTFLLLKRKGYSNNKTILYFFSLMAIYALAAFSFYFTISAL